ncbi:LysM peptidoglycan-binding domain-containing protein [Lactococcus cremoris subsp. cremoris HP]
MLKAFINHQHLSQNKHQVKSRPLHQQKLVHQLVSSTAASSSSSSSEAADTYTYTIATGDYPSTIAAKTGIPWATIASLNGISADGYNADGSAIHAGQILKLK